MNSELNFGPAYFPGIIGANGKLSAFCKGNSSTQSNPNNSQSVTDNRVAAADGSIAATNGGSVTVNNTDGDVLAALAETSAETSTNAIKGAVDAAKTAVMGTGDVAKSALNANVDVFGFANDTIRNSNNNATDLAGAVAKGALTFAEESQAGAARTIGEAYSGFTNKLSDNAGIAPSSQVDNIVKYLTIGATIIGLVIAFRSMKKGNA